MTVSSTVTKISYAGNGSTTAFAVGFYFLANSHLRVILRSTTGVETVKTLTTDYTVTGAGNTSGGTLTMNVAPAAGETLVILRNAPLTQLVDYVTNDPFPANTHEQALDQLTMEVQQLQEKIDRALKIAETDSTSLSTTVPTSNLRANKALVFDSSGSLTISTDDFINSATNAAASALAASSSANSSANSALTSLSYLNQFRGSYYGALSGDPTLDPLGNAPTSGDLYFNTISNTMKTYNSLNWVDVGVATPVAFSTQLFNGTGSQTVFTLSASPYAQAATEVFISGVAQMPGTVWSVTGNTLTFTSAPASGTNNIFVRWASAVSLIVPNDGSVTTQKILDANVTPAKLDRAYTEKSSDTGSAKLPTGTSAQRDGSPGIGWTRFNTTLSKAEVYNGSAWGSLGGGATGGGTDAVFQENSRTVTSSYTLTTGKNAMAVGPLTLNAGVVVTVPTGARLVVL